MQVNKFLFYCRYHYNVTDVRIAQHIEKGNEDGLFISCVSSSSNLWALIMDAGTGFSSQVYELSQSFLHKVNCWNLFMNTVVLFLNQTLLFAMYHFVLHHMIPRSCIALVNVFPPFF